MGKFRFNEFDVITYKTYVEAQRCCLLCAFRETIFGYEDLKIQVYIAAGSLKSQVSIKYNRKISSTVTDGIEVEY